MILTIKFMDQIYRYGYSLLHHIQTNKEKEWVELAKLVTCIQLYTVHFYQPTSVKVLRSHQYRVKKGDSTSDVLCLKGTGVYHDTIFI